MVRPHQVSLEAEVESLDVALHIGDHLGPVVLGAQVGAPATLFLIGTSLRQDSSVVHHLLGDAADIDAGAAELPGGADGSRRDVVSASDLLAKFSSGLRGRETAGTTTDDEEVIVVLGGL